jgi:putative addiction module antidote
MNRPLKIVKIGNSAGIVLPKEWLTKLRVGEGDEVYPLETPDGLQLTAHDPVFARKMELAEKIMREDRDILHVLAQ